MQPVSPTPTGEIMKLPPALSPFEKSWSDLDKAISGLMDYIRKNMRLTHETAIEYRSTITWENDFNSRLIQSQIAINDVAIYGNRWLCLAKVEKKETLAAYQASLFKHYQSMRALVLETQKSLIDKTEPYSSSKSYQFNLNQGLKVNKACRKCLQTALNVFTDLMTKADTLLLS